MTQAERPIIRNLTTLSADMADELRQILHLLYPLYVQQMHAESGDAETVARVETKVRNVLEYLTGSRD